MILIALLYVLQIRPQHVEDDPGISPEQQRILRHKKVAAPLAQAGDLYASPAGAELSVLDHHTLAAGRGKTVVDQIGKGAFQVEYRRALVHHAGDHPAAGRLLFAGQGQGPGVRIGRVEIEGHGPDVLRVPGGAAHVRDGVLVDLVDGHIKADIVRRGPADVLEYQVVGIPADGVVPLPVSVQAQQDQVRLRQVQGKGAVGDHVEEPV